MARHLIVTGRVQGVGYRQWMCNEALALGLTGWVRNRADGSVEAVVDGAGEPLRLMIERAHRGPPAAKVAAVAVSESTDLESTDLFSSFECRRSV